MAEREPEAHRDRALALLHELARDIVDGGDVIGIDPVAQAKAPGERGGAQQQRLRAQGAQCPGPCRQIGEDQGGEQDEDAALERGAMEETGERDSHRGANFRQGRQGPKPSTRKAQPSAQPVRAATASP
jgi:hypothetical protein